MKNKVIKFFQNLPEAPHEQFNEAFALYRESEGKNQAVERVINATGYTPSALSNLLYDLQKLHGITDVEKVSQVGSQKLEVGSEEVVKQLPNDDDYTTVMQTEKAFYPETKDLQKEGVELKQLFLFNQKSVKLDTKDIREEFPFLNNKDCPNELKILVADKITAWKYYQYCQGLISRMESGELEGVSFSKDDLAKESIEAFNENKLIYDELNCYQTNGKILGVHPMFKKLRLTREVEEMTADELIKYKGSSAKYFSVKKTALAKAKKAKDEAKVADIETALAERHDKLFLVNKKLGV